MHSTATVTSIFFFNDTATTEIYTLSLHDALPISPAERQLGLEPVLAPHGARERTVELAREVVVGEALRQGGEVLDQDRKSTRLNSSHANISYAVFCLKKKKILHLLASGGDRVESD